MLAISVKFPFTSRRWALPVLAALYRPKELDLAEGRRHKTAPDLARQLMAVLIQARLRPAFLYFSSRAVSCATTWGLSFQTFLVSDTSACMS